MQETPSQFWEIGMYDLRCNSKIFYIDFSYSKERQSSAIPFIADIRN